MEVDKERIEKYLGEIAAEAFDIKKVLEKSNAEILKDQHVLKSLKYSTIVIAEAVASTLQHFLAKKHNCNPIAFCLNPWHLDPLNPLSWRQRRI